MANDIVAIAASIKIIVFISIDEKTAGQCSPVSRKISYYDGLQFVDAKDRSPAANIDADRALIGFKEMRSTPVDASHQAVEVTRGEIGGLAVERATLVNDFQRRQNPALLDIVEFD
jgi:hypothetical protein